MTLSEQRVVATHEAGHAICAMFCPHSPPIDRISIRGDMAGALGFVRYQDPSRKYVVTRGELLDDLVRPDGRSRSGTVAAGRFIHWICG